MIETRYMTRREIRRQLREWGDQLIKRLDAGEVVDLFENSKRPDVLYLVAIAYKESARPIELKTMEAGA